jgi:uncharacterized membrane protein
VRTWTEFLLLYAQAAIGLAGAARGWLPTPIQAADMTTRERAKRTVVCDICGKHISIGKAYPVELVQESLLELIRQEHPDAVLEHYICLDELAAYRLRLVHSIVAGGQQEQDAVAHDLQESLEQEEAMAARDAYAEYDTRSTMGERVADRVASFGGSWAFIGSFGAILLLWISLNVVGLLSRPFDPYPFILLNLVLSCIAALQAPVIMMSQNRKEAKDRLRSENDYHINLRAEIEVRSLHRKLDLLISHQWQRLLEIQEIQTEMLETFAAGKPKH